MNGNPEDRRVVAELWSPTGTSRRDRRRRTASRRGASGLRPAARSRPVDRRRSSRRPRTDVLGSRVPRLCGTPAASVSHRTVRRPPSCPGLSVPRRRRPGRRTASTSAWTSTPVARSSMTRGCCTQRGCSPTPTGSSPGWSARASQLARKVDRVPARSRSGGASTCPPTRRGVDRVLPARSAARRSPSGPG